MEVCVNRGDQGLETGGNLCVFLVRQEGMTPRTVTTVEVRRVKCETATETIPHSTVHRTFAKRE